MKPGFLALLLMLAMMASPARAQQRSPGNRDMRSPDRVQEGDAAPNFKLKSKDGKAEVELSKMRDQPVVLIFGSYT